MNLALFLLAMGVLGVALLLALGAVSLAATWIGWSRQQRDAARRNRRHVH